MTGKPVLGYDHKKINAISANGDLTFSHSEHEINYEEALIVKNIFTMYGDGIGLKKIAKVLNGDTDSNHTDLLTKYFNGIVPKKGKANKNAWSHVQVRAILHNERYTGKITYGRTKHVYKSGSRVTEKSDDYVTIIKPELRIIPKQLWEKVVKRLSESKNKYVNSRGGNVPFNGNVNNVAESKFLLSGLCECNECGGTYVALGGTSGSGSNRKKRYKYGCGSHHNKGNTICTNNHTIIIEDLDEAVTEMIQNEFLDNTAIDYIINKAIEIIKEKKNQSPDVKRDLINDHSKMIKEISKLIELVFNGVESQQLSDKIKEREERKSFLEEEISRLEDVEKSQNFNPNDLKTKLKSRVNDFKSLISDQIFDARKALKHLLSQKIRIIPNGNKSVQVEAKTHAGKYMEAIDDDDHIGLICS